MDLKKQLFSFFSKSIPLRLPRVRDCAAEARPSDETAEAEQGQRSVFCEGAATPEAKAGHRNQIWRAKHD